MIFKISRFKIIYFFMHFNSVLVYTIVMKRYVTYPDWVEKFRSPGHTIKKTKQGYGLYSCTSKYVPGGNPKSILERSLLMVLFLSLSFLNILSMSNLDWVTSLFQALNVIWFAVHLELRMILYILVLFSIFLEAVKISSYLLASLLTKTRNLYANIEILFLLHA